MIQHGALIAALFLIGAVAFIFYTYAGYPALLALVAAFRNRPVQQAAHSPPATLLIAAYNEEESIGHKIENSLALEYPPARLQIIVAADGSTDGTAEIVTAYAERGVVLSHVPTRSGKMAAINRAMPLATGDIVVFSDANNFYDRDALRRLVAPFADDTVGATTGSKVIVEGDGKLGETEGLYWRYESFVKRQESRIDSCVGAPGEIFALRRELFEAPPPSVINDDFYMALRVLRRGYRVLYVSEARSRERVSPTAGTEVARRTRIVAGRYQAMFYASRLLPWRRPWLVWQIFSHKFARPLVPLAMIVALAANAIMAIYSWPLARLLLLLHLLFYLMALLGSRIELRGLPGKVLYLPTYLVSSNWAALQGLFRFLTRRQTVQWQRVPRRTTSTAGGKKGQ